MAKLNPEDRTKIIIAVISAVAVILAAVIGVAWPDIRAWFSDGRDLSKLGGVWRGEITLPNGDRRDMTLTLGGRCVLNQVCGTFMIGIPNSEACTADVTIVSVEANRYIVEASHLSASCPIVEYRYFEYLDNNTLIYEVGGGTAVGRGTLKRVP